MAALATADELRSIAAMARRLARPGADADDMRQEGEVAAWRARDRDPSASSALVVHAARMAMLAARRRALGWDAGLAAAVVRESGRRGGAPAVPGWMALDLRIALDATLRPELAETLRRRLLSGMTDAEAAAAMGVSRACVTARSRKALAAMRAALGPSYADTHGRSVPLRDPGSYRHQARRSGPSRPRRGPSPPDSGAKAIAAKLAVIAAARDLP